MRVPLVDLHAQYQAIKPDIDAAIQRVLDRGSFILGPEVEALEREVAAYCGTAHAVGVASGTDALELALRACGVGSGDEVITSALSFFATAQAIAAVGATPVFVDIDPVSYTLNPALVEQAVTPRTKALLPVHLYGHPCEMDALARIAAARRLALIEDCAQAIGAAYQGRRVGAFGIAGCFSFYPTKNLGAYGDGGMVVTSDARLAEQLRILRVHGSRDRSHHELLSRNSRLDELQAAILRVKLGHLEAWNEARRRHAATYQRLIEQAELPHVVTPQEQPGCRHVYHLYVLLTHQRDALLRAFHQHDIGAQIHYALALPHQPVFASLNHRQGDFPVAERIAAQALSLPMYPELTAALSEQVVSHLARALGPMPSRSSS